VSRINKLKRALGKLHSEDRDIRDEGLSEIRDLLPDARIAGKVVAAACDQYPRDFTSVNAKLMELLWSDENHDPCLVHLIDEHFDSMQFDSEAQSYSLRVLSEMRTPESLKMLATILARPASRALDPELALIPLRKPRDVDSSVFPELLDAVEDSKHRLQYYDFLLDLFGKSAFDPKPYPAFVQQCINRIAEISREHGESIGLEEHENWTDGKLLELVHAEEELEMLLDLARSFDGREVDSLLLRATELRSTRLQLFATTSLIDKGHEFSTDRLTPLAKDPSDRWILWEMLERIDRLDLFPRDYHTRDQLAEAEMVKWLEHPNELHKAPDEIRLLCRVTTPVDEQECVYFVFRYRADEVEDGQWLVGWAGPYPVSEPPRMGGRRTFSHFHPAESKSIYDHVHDFVGVTVRYKLDDEPTPESWLRRFPDRDEDSLAQLTELDFEGEDFTDADVSLLVRCPSLRKLNLNNTKITDDALAWIARIKSLEWLEIEADCLTDSAVRTLATMSNIKYVALPMSVSEQAVAGLRSALPNAEIRHQLESHKNVFRALAKAGALPLRQGRHRCSYGIIAVILGLLLFIVPRLTFAGAELVVNAVTQTAWTIWLYLLVVIARPNTPLISAAAITLTMAWSFEFSLLWQPNWPAAVLGRLGVHWPLAATFQPFHLVCQLAGVALAVLFDRHILPKKAKIDWPALVQDKVDTEVNCLHQDQR
jgi:hypothetical protein